MRNLKTKQMTYILIVTFVIILFSILIITRSILNKPFETRYINVEFIVNDTVGFDINSTALKFGRLTPGSSSTRTIIIDNSYNFTLYGKIFASNNIANLLMAPDNFVISPNNKTFVVVTLYVPDNYKFGVYYGKLRVELNR
jgi:hypothetical protein